MEKINEGNKLIADFMGQEVMQLKTAMSPQGGYHLMRENHGGYEPLKYHSSWGWLMPVVEKIGKFEISENHCLFSDGEGDFLHREANTTIEATWLAVVDFIELHHH